MRHRFSKLKKKALLLQLNIGDSQDKIIAKKLLVAIPAYNRLDLLEKCLRSVAFAKIPANVVFEIFDDASSTINWEIIQNSFPFINTIHRFELNGGADENILRILRSFKNSAHTHLLFLDSDCLVNENIFVSLLTNFDSEQIIWSAYRSRFHSESFIGSNFVEKDSLGALGLLLTQTHMLNIDPWKTEAKAVDWQIILKARDRGILFCAPLNSLIEHIGWQGSHNEIGSPDIAIGFEPSNKSDELYLQKLHNLHKQNLDLKGRLLTYYRKRFPSPLRYQISSFVKRRLFFWRRNTN